MAQLWGVNLCTSRSYTARRFVLRHCIWSLCHCRTSHTHDSVWEVECSGNHALHNPSLSCNFYVFLSVLFLSPKNVKLVNFHTNLRSDSSPVVHYTGLSGENPLLTTMYLRTMDLPSSNRFFFCVCTNSGGMGALHLHDSRF